MIMKGDIMREILERIAEAPALLGDLLVITTSPRGTSYRGMQRRLSAHHANREKNLLARQKKRQLYNVLYELRRQKLIAERKTKSEITYAKTKRGMEKLVHLRELKNRFLPRKTYVTQPEKDIKIIVFDIPEKERRKRDWLRVVLKRIGFSMAQRSVWIGTNAVPEDLVNDLSRLNLLPYVKILAVTKKGNLTPIL